MTQDKTEELLKQVCNQQIELMKNFHNYIYDMKQVCEQQIELLKNFHNQGTFSALKVQTEPKEKEPIQKYQECNFYTIKKDFKHTFEMTGKHALSFIKDQTTIDIEDTVLLVCKPQEKATKYLFLHPKAAVIISVTYSRYCNFSIYAYKEDIDAKMVIKIAKDNNRYKMKPINLNVWSDQFLEQVVYSYRSNKSSKLRHILEVLASKIYQYTILRHTILPEIRTKPLVI